MKYEVHLVILSFTIALSPVNLFSQNYLSLFGDSSTTWDIILHGYCDAVCSQTVVVGSDTVINANTYRIVPGLPGFLRENTTQGKAWFYDTNHNTEYLIMDLSLNSGDTFNIYSWNNTSNPFTVDSVYFIGGKKHVRINAWTSICGLNEKITFIEGTGTSASFNYQRDMSGNSVSSYMLCQHKNGVKIEGNVLFMDSCNICSVGMMDNYSDIESFRVFPNPTSGELKIETIATSYQDSRVTIYNALGEQMLSHPLNSALQSIDVSTLENGTYIAVITNISSNKHRIFIKQ